MAPMTDRVPIRETGMATPGIIVARQFCRKIKMITKTIRVASIRVLYTWLMDASTKMVVSKGTSHSRPWGKTLLIPSMDCRMSLAVFSALAPGSRYIAIPAESLPLVWKYWL